MKENQEPFIKTQTVERNFWMEQVNVSLHLFIYPSIVDVEAQLNKEIVNGNQSK